MQNCCKEYFQRAHLKHLLLTIARQFLWWGPTLLSSNIFEAACWRCLFSILYLNLYTLGREARPIMSDAIPGYGGFVPSSRKYIGPKPGYRPDLAGPALELDHEYHASAQRYYSKGGNRSCYQSDIDTCTGLKDYKDVEVNMKGNSATKEVYVFIQTMRLDV